MAAGDQTSHAASFFLRDTKSNGWMSSLDSHFLNFGRSNAAVVSSVEASIVSASLRFISSIIFFHVKQQQTSKSVNCEYGVVELLLPF